MRRIELPGEDMARGRSARSKRATVAAAVAAGAAVAGVLALYASQHAATGTAPLTLGFSLPGEMKIWLTRIAIALGVLQLGSGLRIRGVIRFPRRIPRWFRHAHRASGAVAILLAVPVAYDCVAAFGLQLGTPRIATHALAGLVLFGAFAAKVVAVERRKRPGWLIPSAGLTLFAAIAAVWLTSLGWPVSIY